MTTLARCILGAGLAATGAGAQERPEGRIAPPAVYDVAPALGAYTDDVLFGEVWKREQLSPRDRSLVTISGLIASGRIPQVRSHARLGLDNGLTPEEIGEIITQLAFYSGWPNAISAVFVVKEVFDERGIGPVEVTDETPLELDPDSEADRRARVDGAVGPVIPGLADYTNRVLFADLWRRPQLSARDRSLVTVAGLIASGQAEQLTFHLNRAMDNGLTREEAAEVPTHLAYYAGFPKSYSAFPVIKAVFEAREALAASPSALEVLVYDPEDGFDGPEDKFTGSVRVDSLSRAEPPARAGGGMVHFEAGARTAWHTHPLGQTLWITEGCGWVQSEGGAVQVVKPGDVVRIPPNTRHWHGASAGAAMSHLAIAEAENGSVVTWMEHVTDEAYGGGTAAERACE